MLARSIYLVVSRRRRFASPLRVCMSHFSRSNHCSGVLLPLKIGQSAFYESIDYPADEALASAVEEGIASVEQARSTGGTYDICAFIFVFVFHRCFVASVNVYRPTICSTRYVGTLLPRVLSVYTRFVGPILRIYGVQICAPYINMRIELLIGVLRRVLPQFSTSQALASFTSTPVCVSMASRVTLSIVSNLSSPAQSCCALLHIWLQAYTDWAKRSGDTSGCCACVVAIRGSVLCAANVG